MRWSFKLTILLMLTILVVLLKGCHLLSDPSLRPFKVGMNYWPGYQVLFYAQRAGIFAKHGLAVELVHFASHQDNLRATMREFQDASLVPLAEVMRVDAGGQPPVYVLVVDQSHGSDGIAALPGIESVKELPGKRVSAKLSSLSHLILLEALQHFQVAPAAVEIVDVSHERGAALLKDKKIQAAVLWEPLLNDTAAAVGGKVIFSTRDVDSLVIDGLATRGQVLQEKRQELVQFIQAWFEVMQAVETDPAAVFQVVAAELGISPQDFAAEYAGLRPGTIAMNQAMFADGHLAEVATATRELLQSDPRHAGVMEADVLIDAGPIREAIQARR